MLQGNCMNLRSLIISLSLLVPCTVVTFDKSSSQIPINEDELYTLLATLERVEIRPKVVGICVTTPTTSTLLTSASAATTTTTGTTTVITTSAVSASTPTAMSTASTMSAPA